MGNNKSTLDVAMALQPIMAYLYQHGVLSVMGDRGAHIQLTEQKFREIWPDVTPDNRGCLTAYHDGHVFTAWIAEAVKNG